MPSGTVPSGSQMHTDDSDVTFNLCLGRNFSGAQLTICGDSRMPEHRQFYYHYVHEIGRCLVHLGSRRHGADDIREGERNNLVSVRPVREASVQGGVTHGVGWG